MIPWLEPCLNSSSVPPFSVFWQFKEPIQGSIRKHILQKSGRVVFLFSFHKLSNKSIGIYTVVLSILIKPSCRANTAAVGKFEYLRDCLHVTQSAAWGAAVYVRTCAVSVEVAMRELRCGDQIDLDHGTEPKNKVPLFAAAREIFIYEQMHFR